MIITCYTVLPYRRFSFLQRCSLSKMYFLSVHCIEILEIIAHFLWMNKYLKITFLYRGVCIFSSQKNFFLLLFPFYVYYPFFPFCFLPFFISFLSPFLYTVSLFTFFPFLLVLYSLLAPLDIFLHLDSRAGRGGGGWINGKYTPLFDQNQFGLNFFFSVVFFFIKNYEIIFKLFQFRS